MNPVVVRWKARLKIRQALLLAARRRHKAEPNRPSLVRAVRHREDQVAEAKRVIARHSTPTVPQAFAGSPVPGQRPVKSTHQTAGLPGFPAVDYFAPSGSPCVAPVTGVVTKTSGHDPANGPVNGPHGPFGWSVYIRGTDGRTYFLTHMGSRSVHEGDNVRQGQKIGTVGNYARWGGTDHIHQGVKAA
jgi:murein DD-endopeptidase MepM/ murein hydrolase activator NlpD